MYTMSGRLDLECSLFESLHVFEMEKMCRRFCGLHNTGRGGRGRQSRTHMLHTLQVCSSTHQPRISACRHEKGIHLHPASVLSNTPLSYCCGLSHIYYFVHNMNNFSIISIHPSFIPSSLSVIILQLVH